MAAKRLAFPARNDVEVQVVDGLPGRCAIELGHQQAIGLQPYFNGAGHFLHLQHVLAEIV